MIALFRAAATTLLACVAISGFEAKAESCQPWDLLRIFCSGSHAEHNQTDRQRQAAQFLKPIPFTLADTRTSSYEFIRHRTTTPIYIRVGVKASSQFAAPSSAVNCDQRSALHKFLGFLGLDQDGTYTVLVKISNDRIATEFIPIAALERHGSRCSTAITESKLITPYLRMDSSGRVNVDVKITFSTSYRIEFVSKLMKAFEIGSVAIPNFASAAALLPHQAGITPKAAIVLTDEERARVNSAVTNLDKAVQDLLAPLDTDSTLTFSTDIDVRLMKGRYFRSFFGPSVTSLNGLEATNFALFVEPRLSVHTGPQNPYRIVPREQAEADGPPVFTPPPTGGEPPSTSDEEIAQQLSRDAGLQGLTEGELRDLLRYGYPQSAHYIVPRFADPLSAVSTYAPFKLDDRLVSVIKKAPTDDLLASALQRIGQSSQPADFDIACRDANTALTQNFALNSYDSLLVIYYYYRGSPMFAQSRDLATVCSSIITTQTAVFMAYMNLPAGVRAVARNLDWDTELSPQSLLFQGGAKVRELPIAAAILNQVLADEVTITDDDLHLAIPAPLFGGGTGVKRDKEAAFRIIDGFQIKNIGCQFRSTQYGLQQNEVPMVFVTAKPNFSGLYYVKLVFDPATPRPAKVKGILVSQLSADMLQAFKEVHETPQGCAWKPWRTG